MKDEDCNHDVLKYLTQLDSNPQVNQRTHGSPPQVSKSGEKQAILISPEMKKQSSKLNTDLVNDDFKVLNELVVTLKDWFTQKSYDCLFNKEILPTKMENKTILRVDSADVNINKNQAEVAITQSFNEKAANFLLRQPGWLSETIVSNKHQFTKSDIEVYLLSILFFKVVWAYQIIF